MSSSVTSAMMQLICDRYVVIATGGTAGHVFPAIALADYLESHDINVKIFTDPRGSQYIHGYNKVVIDITRHKNMFMYGTNLLDATIKSAMQMQGASLIIGFGAYCSVPSVLGGILRLKPIFLFEHDMILGKANRYLSIFAKKIFTAFPQSLSKHSLFTGPIVRNSITRYISDSQPSLKSISRIVVIGGSQGAFSFARCVTDAICACKSTTMPSVVHVAQQVCSEEQIEQVVAQYNQYNIQCEAVKFFHNIGEVLASADLVIARAGSATISELVALAKPAVLIPYEYAKNQHQHKNAQYLASKECCWIASEQSLLDLLQTIDSAMLYHVNNNIFQYSKNFHHNPCEIIYENIKAYL